MISPFMLATSITVLFMLLKFIEKRVILKSEFPLKVLIRDCLVVYLSSVAGFYILTNFLPETQVKVNTKVFTNNPEF